MSQEFVIIFARSYIRAEVSPVLRPCAILLPTRRRALRFAPPSPPPSGETQRVRGFVTDFEGRDVETLRDSFEKLEADAGMRFARQYCYVMFLQSYRTPLQGSGKHEEGPSLLTLPSRPLSRYALDFRSQVHAY